ncbi:MAG: poly-gamma-glutamate system protein [Pirellulales bacterium]
MKSIYWRPQKVSRPTLVMISLSAICVWALVHGAYLLGSAEHGSMKLQAASRAEESFQAIRAARIERGDTINRVLDPTDSGLLGVAMSQVTSRPAELADKQTSVNPNIAAAIVEMLLDAGVERGDTVAIGWTGSLPALNIALCAAMESLELIPIAVASVTSSQYGANRPDFLWLDMERILAEQQLISFRSHAASIGGIADRGLGMSAPALEQVTAGIRRNHLPMIGTQSRAESIDQRMQIYTTKARIKPIKLYVNVGGGVVSTGGSEAKRHYQPGLNRTLPAGMQECGQRNGPIFQTRNSRYPFGASTCTGTALRISVRTEADACGGNGTSLSCTSSQSLACRPKLVVDSWIDACFCINRLGLPNETTSPISLPEISRTGSSDPPSNTRRSNHGGASLDGVSGPHILLESRGWHRQSFGMDVASENLIRTIVNVRSTRGL